jgi:hypothetical protein
MRAIRDDLEGLVDELAGVLEENIHQVKLTIVRLDELRGAVIKRDEAGLRALLTTIQDEGPEYNMVEMRREGIRKRLAGILGCRAEELNLSQICECLSEEKREAILSRQKELQVLARRLRVEHTSTRVLLMECRRFNNALLRGIFGEGGEGVTYDKRGGASWECEGSTTNLRL